MKSLKKLKRITDKEWLGGVCAGLAYFFEVPVWIVRLLWACAVLFFGFGVLLYILLWIFIPEAEETPADFTEKTGE